MRNPKKFQFAQSEVEFIGFKITKTGLQPTDAFLECIRSFPEPKNLTDVRAWFGTVNQVSYSFAVAEQIEPFRRLLSSKLPFAWSAELSSAFHKYKMEKSQTCEVGGALCAIIRKYLHIGSAAYSVSQLLVETY